MSDARHRRGQPLTDAQQMVLDELVQGFTNGEIADRLDIAYGTVQHHVHGAYVRVFGRLSPRSRARVRLAIWWHERQRIRSNKHLGGRSV